MQGLLGGCEGECHWGEWVSGDGVVGRAGLGRGPMGLSWGLESPLSLDGGSDVAEAGQDPPNDPISGPRSSEQVSAADRVDCPIPGRWRQARRCLTRPISRDFICLRLDSGSSAVDFRDAQPDPEGKRRQPRRQTKAKK